MKTMRRYMSTHTNLRTTCKWSDSRSGRFTSRRQAHCIKAWIGPRATMDGMEMSFFCPNRDSNPGSPVQPVPTSLYQMCYLHTVYKLLFQSLTITLVSYMFNVHDVSEMALLPPSLLTNI